MQAVKETESKLIAPRRRGRDLPPGPGRPKGSTNRVTMTIKAAIEAAVQPGACHPEGLAGWLIDRAKGGLGDRQIFASVVNKFVPVQLNATVDGGIKLELGWLGGRQVGTTPTQLQQQAPQVIEMQQENGGVFRIIDPQPVAQGGGQARAEGGQAVRDPHPPVEPGAGG